MSSKKSNHAVIDSQLLTFLEEQAIVIRGDILTMIYNAKSGHPGGSLSSTEILTSLYFHLMNINPDNPDWAERDRFILSKGHACPVWYACLAEKGYFSKSELLNLRKIDSILQGHPDMKKTPGVDFTTGSLGQGLSAGVGIALALKTDHPNNNVYVVLGDGEINEGQIWEAAMSAAKFELGNLVVFIDYNNLQLDGTCDQIMPIEPLKEKWQSFNWHVQEINGHSFPEIINSVEFSKKTNKKPSIIIAHTIKGKGVSYMENKCDWHGKAPNLDQYLQALEEIGVDPERSNLVRYALAEKKADVLVSTSESLAIPNTKNPKKDRPRPTRDAYGDELVKLGIEFPHLVVLEADISTSTRTRKFSEVFPDRFYQFGVAEANTMAAAAGMAATGKIPFVSTYAVFASMRACEQVRTMIAYPNLNVKIAVSHGGITPANDGVTHQGTEDLGIMRTIPNLTVIMPADYNATRILVREAALYEGPVYLRFTRDAVPLIYDENAQFEIGKGVILRKGKDITLIAIGDMVWIALLAADKLERKGLSVQVLDIHTVKPIDRELIVSCLLTSKRAITIEDHQIIGGLGSAVAEIASEMPDVQIRRIGLQNTFAESGQYPLLLKKYGMDVDAVLQKADQLLKEKDTI